MDASTDHPWYIMIVVTMFWCYTVFVYLYIVYKQSKTSLYLGFWWGTTVELSLFPLCPQNSLNSLGYGLYKVSKAAHRVADPCWLQCVPQCQVGWMSFGWWTILDTHGKLLIVKNPAALQFLTQTGAPGTYYHTPFKGTSIFCLAPSLSEWHTHTIRVSILSRLKNPS
jgi:hypothetical protein